MPAEMGEITEHERSFVRRNVFLWVCSYLLLLLRRRSSWAGAMCASCIFRRPLSPWSLRMSLQRHTQDNESKVEGGAGCGAGAAPGGAVGPAPLHFGCSGLEVYSRVCT